MTCRTCSVAQKKEMASPHNDEVVELDHELQPDQDAEQYRCRMYENKYPEVDDLIIVQVKQIADIGVLSCTVFTTFALYHNKTCLEYVCFLFFFSLTGAYVSLLEYDNIEGMIPLTELSNRRIRSFHKLIRVGRIEIAIVLRVDKEKGETFLTRVFPSLSRHIYISLDCVVISLSHIVFCFLSARL